MENTDFIFKIAAYISVGIFIVTLIIAKLADIFEQRKRNKISENIKSYSKHIDESREEKKLEMSWNEWQEKNK